MSNNNKDQNNLSQLYTEGVWSNIKAKSAAAVQGVKNVGHLVSGDNTKVRTSDSAKFRSSVNSLASILAQKTTEFSKNLENIKSKIDPNSDSAKNLQQLVDVGTAVKNRIAKTTIKATANLK